MLKSPLNRGYKPLKRQEQYEPDIRPLRFMVVKSLSILWRYGKTSTETLPHGALGTWRAAALCGDRL